MSWPVSQHGLHNSSLRLRDRWLKGASLFPFFSDDGSVRGVMLTTVDSPAIHLLDWRPGLFERSWIGVAKVDQRWGDCLDCDAESARRFADLWHFDPWWELGEHRYAGHSAVPLLKGTNIPGFEPSIQRVWFDSRVERVTWIARKEAEIFRVRRFSREALGEASGARASISARPPGEVTREGWRLRPFWSA